VTASGTDIPAMRANRGTLYVEDAKLVSTESFPGDQFVQRLEAPMCASRATPGSFVHVQCDPSIPMRRPLSIMRASTDDGWIEILFKTVGEGLAALGRKEPGDRLSIIGPIGHGFAPQHGRTRHVLIGGGVGIPPMVFLAEQLQRAMAAEDTLVFMGSELPFPFALRNSVTPLDGLPADVVATMPLLDDKGIACRLASMAGFGGCYRGYVTDLTRQYLETLGSSQLEQTALYACGPTPMLAAVAALAREFQLPCQVSLEEFMACGVGGCAGCTVPYRDEDGPAMKRVCVDGPVFDAGTVFGIE
jgi:dihydroorotate dehydrogenase electron transfer subunit